MPDLDFGQITGTASVLFLFGETLVHAGAGRMETVVDLPIQRSVQTGWPILNDSTLRGSFRRLVAPARESYFFGTGDSPGKVATPDAEALLFPVAAAAGLTAWVTCMTALRYFLRNAALFNENLDQHGKDRLAELKGYVAAEEGPANGTAWVASQCDVQWPGQQVIVESDAYAIEGNGKAENIAQWMANCVQPFDDYWKERIRTHFVLIPEAAFTHYVQTRTDLRTRISISEGRASDKALWTEENLPIDTVMFTVFSGERMAEYLGEIRIAERPVVQLGGDQNLGRGLMRLRQMGM